MHRPSHDRHRHPLPHSSSRFFLAPVAGASRWEPLAAAALLQLLAQPPLHALSFMHALAHSCPRLPWSPLNSQSLRWSHALRPAPPGSPATSPPCPLAWLDLHLCLHTHVHTRTAPGAAPLTRGPCDPVHTYTPNRDPPPGKQLEVEFNWEAGQAAPIRQRAYKTSILTSKRFICCWPF